MPDPNLVSLAKQLAAAEGLDPALVCAVVEQESNWQTWAIRYEPLFMSKYVAPLYTNHKITATEAYSRGFSWGLMQVMGQVARELGYAAPLPQLCDPHVGLLWGCKHLKHKADSVDGDLTKTLLAWNGGSNAQYPIQVIGRIPSYK